MKRDDEIFAEALELGAAERAAFLDRACAGDAAQRARVLALLAAHEEAGRFLEGTPAPRPPPVPEEKPGDTLGRYTLVRKIGEGGCGVVWLADQREPVRRQVALKIIKLGMDTRQVIARFEAERQALALMEHPDIARVFDAGATDTGRPFFVMEFVDGQPITKFCDAHSLSMAARLELFARVCLALQHAHQKGIIHRDLKPSNVLVVLRDGVPMPKVIDFGIAKATQGRLTEETLLTGFDQLIGTPAYMSPEQAELREIDIDTRSDVYSLGVLLYELLTGRPPFEPQSLVRAGIEEIRRIIREVEPPRPSTRVSTLTDADRATIARLRGAAPMQLTSVLRGDLDWIVMRCLEKDRERRYGTAKELADDVHRHLWLEPVVARPPSALYRAQKFVSRNRLACASAATVAAALVIGTVVSTQQAIRARRAERAATAERDTAQAATRAEAVARADAQRRQEQAESLFGFMVGDFRTDLKKLGRLDLLDPVGEKAMAYFASLDPRDLTDTALTGQVKALTQIGETRIDEAKYAEADAAFAAADTRATALTTRHPRDADMLFERAQVEYWIGFIARRRGDFAKTREWFVRYRDSAIALVAIEGKKLRAQRELTSGEHNLAVVEFDAGNLAAAQRGFAAERKAVETMLADNPGDAQLRFRLADIASWLAQVAECDGNFPEALARFTEMSSRVETLAEQEPKVARWKYKQTESRTFVGNILALQGRVAEAADHYARSESLLKTLVEQDPKNQQLLLALVALRLQRTNLGFAAGQSESAQKVLDAARDNLETLFAAEPTARGFTRHLAAAWRLEAGARFSAHRADAADAATRALTLAESLVKETPDDRWALWELAQSCVLAGRIAAARNDSDSAKRYWARAVALLEPRLRDSNEWRYLDPAAQAYVLLGQPDQAHPLIERLQRFGYRPIDPLAAPLLGIPP